MPKKIRYPRVTLEICDAVLTTVTDGLKMEFLSDYPNLTCYNGRSWEDEEGGEFTIYYVKSTFNASYRPIHSNTIDARIVIVRLKPGYRIPSFWSTIWFRTGLARFPNILPEEFEPKIHRKHFSLTREYKEEVWEFDPIDHLPGLSMVREELPPPPIKF